MNTRRRMIITALFTAMTLPGCASKNSGPASVTETSVSRKELADKIRFVENYVTFRRQYEELDYNIMYQNNGGGITPGPSDWDIQLIAVVPNAEVEEWIPDGAETSDGLSPEWLKNIPGKTDRGGLTEWYKKGSTMVGVDRVRSIVAYRSASTPD